MLFKIDIHRERRRRPFIIERGCGLTAIQLGRVSFRCQCLSEGNRGFNEIDQVLGERPHQLTVTQAKSAGHTIHIRKVSKGIVATRCKRSQSYWPETPKRDEAFREEGPSHFGDRRCLAKLAAKAKGNRTCSGPVIDWITYCSLQAYRTPFEYPTMPDLAIAHA